MTIKPTRSFKSKEEGKLLKESPIHSGVEDLKVTESPKKS